MRKLMRYVVPIVLLFGSGAAHAQSNGKGGSPQPITSAESVKAAKGDQIVKLRGQIVRQEEDGRYTFSDGTAEVIVEMNSRVVKGPVPPGTRVEIVGEVEKRLFARPIVQAKSVTVLASSPVPVDGDVGRGTPSEGGASLL